jgi:hypothetical protein
MQRTLATRAVVSPGYDADLAERYGCDRNSRMAWVVMVGCSS